VKAQFAAIRHDNSSMADQKRESTNFQNEKKKNYPNDSDNNA